MIVALSVDVNIRPGRTFPVHGGLEPDRCRGLTGFLNDIAVMILFFVSGPCCLYPFFDSTCLRLYFCSGLLEIEYAFIDWSISEITTHLPVKYTNYKFPGPDQWLDEPYCLQCRSTLAEKFEAKSSLRRNAPSSTKIQPAHQTTLSFEQSTFELVAGSGYTMPLSKLAASDHPCHKSDREPAKAQAHTSDASAQSPPASPAHTPYHTVVPTSSAHSIKAISLRESHTLSEIHAPVNRTQESHIHPPYPSQNASHPPKQISILIPIPLRS